MSRFPSPILAPIGAQAMSEHSWSGMTWSAGTLCIRARPCAMSHDAVERMLNSNRPLLIGYVRP